MGNRCPTSAVIDMTPREAWTGDKSSVDFLRVFGCVAYVHVPEAKRTIIIERRTPRSPESLKWRNAMDAEIEAIERNDIRRLVNLQKCLLQ